LAPDLIFDELRDAERRVLGFELAVGFQLVR
jgi:hypothetical protein